MFAKSLHSCQYFMQSKISALTKKETVKAQNILTPTNQQRRATKHHEWVHPLQPVPLIAKPLLLMGQTLTTMMLPLMSD